jgi:hypothetical protein
MTTTPAGSSSGQNPAPEPSFHPARLYVASVRRSISHYGFSPVELFRRWNDHPVFIVGSPRSGTSFTAETIGGVSGFADLGELRPLKASIAQLYQLPVEAAAARIRTMVRRTQRLGLISSRRGIEQTPESTFLIPAIASAFPHARFVHLFRDGRDVAASLIGLGWLGENQTGTDEVGHRFGVRPRFWVEPERRAEFAAASTGTRAAWVWRRYESTARTLLAPLKDRTIDIRYERLVAEPSEVAKELARFLGADERTDEFVAGFGETRGSAAGRWRTDLAPAELADVEREAGELLRELGYAT